jgi:tRNA threonylcarbamoyladenosine biosynthesis protein TsaE
VDYELVSKSVEQTIELGREIGRGLKGGEVIALVGPLGSGKTYLVKGIALGAGAEGAALEVNSPTFVIVNQYRGRVDLFHIDAYRLNSIEEFEMLGFDDLCYPNSVVLIEWADRVAKALQNVNYVLIKLSHDGETKRKIHIENIPGYFSLKP